MNEEKREVAAHRPNGLLLLGGVVVALLVGNVFLLWKTADLGNRLTQIQNREPAEAAIAKEFAAAPATVAPSSTPESVADLRKSLEEIEKKLEAYHTEALQQARTARTQAENRSRQIVNQYSAQQKKDREKERAEVAKSLDELKASTETATKKVDQAKSDIDKTLADLTSVRGDLGVQSGLIATNSRELAALRALGERNYVEFDLKKTKEPQRVGATAVQLKRTDTKRNRYTIDVIADDKRVEKKDRTINEPVQFYVSRSQQPLELVVNAVHKDRIVGYLAVPKPRQTAAP